MVAVGVLTMTRLKPPAPNLATGQSLSVSEATVAALPDGSAIELEAGAAVAVESETADRVQLALSRGVARFDVVRRPTRQFVVTIDDVRVEVIGTRFEVARREGGAVRVSVERGVVDVNADGFVKRLLAGESWERRGATGVGRGADSPEPSREGDRSERAAPLPTVEPLELPSASAPKEKPKREPKSNQRLKDREGHPEDVFAGALDARRMGRWAEAADLSKRFLKLYPEDPRAALVAFELGRLQFDKLHLVAEASQSFERALALDTRGEVTEEALARLVTALEALGRFEGCRRRQAEYVRRFPAGPFVGTVRNGCGVSSK
jgi:transmembrane sensor